MPYKRILEYDFEQNDRSNTFLCSVTIFTRIMELIH